MELVKDAKAYTDKVSNNPAYNSLTETEKLEEALVMAIGDKGESFVTTARKNSFKEFISNLFDEIGKYFGLKNLTGKQLADLSFDDFTKMVAADLLSGNKISDITSRNDVVALAMNTKLLKMANGAFVNSITQLKTDANTYLVGTGKEYEDMDSAFKQNLIETYGFKVNGFDSTLHEFDLEFVGHDPIYARLGFWVTADGQLSRADSAMVKNYVETGFIALLKKNSYIKAIVNTAFFRQFVNLNTMVTAFDYGNNELLKKMVTDNMIASGVRANTIRNILIEPMKRLEDILNNGKLNSESNDIAIEVWAEGGTTKTVKVPVSVAMSMVAKHLTQMESYNKSTLISADGKLYATDSSGAETIRRGGLWKKQLQKEGIAEAILSLNEPTIENVWLLMQEAEMAKLQELFVPNAELNTGFGYIKNGINDKP